MKPKYLQPDSTHRDRWMVSYLDAMTILLIFFVAAAAKTMPAPVKPVQPLPTPKPVLIDARPPAPGKIEVALQKTGLDVHRDPRGLVISLPQKILFSSGDDRIGSDAFPVIEQVAGILHDIPNQVILIGHADSVPIHNGRFKNNWELSAARGLRLLELLNSRYDIDETRMSVSSDGSNRPATSNDTPDGRAANRRAEVVILDEPQSHTP
jgi:chemotaxis protein MotB